MRAIDETMQGKRKVGPHQVNARRAARLLALGQLKGQDHGQSRSGMGRASWFRAVPTEDRIESGRPRGKTHRRLGNTTPQRRPEIPVT